VVGIVRLISGRTGRGRKSRGNRPARTDAKAKL
jgi:hypothetical protein